LYYLSSEKRGIILFLSLMLSLKKPRDNTVRPAPIRGLWIMGKMGRPIWINQPQPVTQRPRIIMFLQTVEAINLYEQM